MTYIFKTHHKILHSTIDWLWSNVQWKLREAISIRFETTQTIEKSGVCCVLPTQRFRQITRSVRVEVIFLPSGKTSVHLNIKKEI